MRIFEKYFFFVRQWIVFTGFLFYFIALFKGSENTCFCFVDVRARKYEVRWSSYVNNDLF